jgi:OOP family OmpA-OmpF porin
MARVKVEPGGRVLIAALVVGALLALFLRVRASVNKPSAPPSSFPTTSVGVPTASVPQKEKAKEPAKNEAEATRLSNSEPVKIYFDFNRANIDKNVYCIFDKIDEMIRSTGSQNIKLMIEGNADSVGPPWYNVDLSRIRAERVADSLSVRLGIPKRNIEIVANGSAKPAASNKTSDGRAENRRSEVHIFR